MHPDNPQQAAFLHPVEPSVTSVASEGMHSPNTLDFLEPDTRPQTPPTQFYVPPPSPTSSLIKKLGILLFGSKLSSSQANASIEQLDSYMEQKSVAISANQYSPETHNAQEASLNVIFSASPSVNPSSQEVRLSPLAEKALPASALPNLQGYYQPPSPAEEAWLNTKKTVLQVAAFTAEPSTENPVRQPPETNGTASMLTTRTEPKFKLGNVKIALNPAEEAITDIRPLAEQQQSSFSRLASATRRLHLPEQGLEITGRLEGITQDAQDSITPELLNIEVTDMVIQLQRKRFRQIAERNRKMRNSLNSMIDDYFANKEPDV